MKRILFAAVVLGQAWVGGHAVAAGCSTGSSFDASCESSAMTYADVQLAGRSVTAATSFAPTAATPANAPRELPLIAAPSSAASTRVLDDVVAGGPSSSSASAASVFAPSVNTRTEGITIAGIVVPELTTALIRPTSANDLTATVGGGGAVLESSPAPALVVTAIPEPGVLLLLGAGLVGVALSRSRRTRVPARIASPC